MSFDAYTPHPKETELRKEALRARDKAKGRKISNNTRAIDRGYGQVAVRLHNTDVVTYNGNGTVTLNSGGWRTVTTKQRMNEYAPVSVYQRDHEWYVSTPTAGEIDYYDGITLDYEGYVVPDEPPQLLAEDLYVPDYRNEHQLP